MKTVHISKFIKEHDNTVIAVNVSVGAKQVARYIDSSPGNRYTSVSEPKVALDFIEKVFTAAGVPYVIHEEIIVGEEKDVDTNPLKEQSRRGSSKVRNQTLSGHDA